MVYKADVTYINDILTYFVRFLKNSFELSRFIVNESSWNIYTFI